MSRKLVAPVDVDPLAVGRPADQAIETLDAGKRARLAAVQRKELIPGLRDRGHHAVTARQEPDVSDLNPFGRERAPLARESVDLPQPRSAALLVRGGHDAARVGEPRRGVAIQSLERNIARLAHPGGQQIELADAARIEARGQDPQSVRRDATRRAVAQTDRRRAVHGPQVHRAEAAAPLGSLVEEHGGVLGAHILEEGPVEPGEVALACFPGRQRADPGPLGAVRHEHSSVARDVVRREIARQLQDAPQLAVQRDRVETAGGALAIGGEPHFAPIGRPRQPLDRAPSQRECAHLALAVDDADRARIRDGAGVVDERDALAVLVDANRSHPARRLIHHRPDRELDPGQSFLGPDDGDLQAVRGPVGDVDAVQHLARRAAHRRHPGQRARSSERAEPFHAEGHGQLVGARHRQQVGARDAQRAGLRIPDMRPEQLQRLALPGRGVHDRVPVRSEPGGFHEAAAEGDALVAHVGDERDRGRLSGPAVPSLPR